MSTFCLDKQNVCATMNTWKYIPCPLHRSRRAQIPPLGQRLMWPHPLPLTFSRVYFMLPYSFWIRFEKCPLQDYLNMKKLHRLYSFLEKNEKRMRRQRIKRCHATHVLALFVRIPAIAQDREAFRVLYGIPVGPESPVLPIHHSRFSMTHSLSLSPFPLCAII